MATIGFPIASASNTVSGVPSHSDGNTLMSKAETTRANVLRKAGEDESIAEIERARLLLERFAQRAFADDEEPGVRTLVQHQPRGVDQVRIPFRVVQPRHGADRHVARRDAKLVRGPRESPPPIARRLNSSSGTPRYTTFTFSAGIRRALITNSAVLFDTAIAMSVTGSSSRVGDFLEPRRVGEVGVLVDDGRQAAHRPGDPPERRRAVAVKVQDVDLLAIDHLQQRRQRRRIELRLVQIRDVDADRLERFLRQVLLPQADERHVVALRVEARNHPGEEPLDAVHPRSFPAEVIADLQDVQLHRFSTARRGGDALRRGEITLPDDARRDADGNRAVGNRFADNRAGADDGAIANGDAVEDLRAGAEPGAGADRARRSIGAPGRGPAATGSLKS